MIKFLSITYLLLLISSCGGRKKLSPDAYVNYLNSEMSDLLISKELNKVNYKLRLLTPEYMVINGNRNTPVNNEQFTTKLKDQIGRINFVMLIEDSENTGSIVKQVVFNTDQYGTLLEYANSNLKNDFMLVRRKDTLFCSLIHMEAANSLQPVVRISFAFEGAGSNDDEFTLIYNDHLFNNGPLKFIYSKETLTQLPELKM